VLHAVIFLVLLVAIALPDTGRPSTVFGVGSSPAEERVEGDEEAPGSPVSAGQIVVYGALTLALWIAVPLQRRRLGARLTRVTLFLLTPGTILWIYAVVQLIAQPTLDGR